MASIKELEKNKIQVEFNVTAEEFKAAEMQVFLKERSEFNVPGFRKGKAPKHVVEQHYGQGMFFEDALDIVFPVSYGKAIDELKFEPVSRPLNVDIANFDPEKGIDITMEVYTKPVVELGEYKGISVEKVSHVVTDEDVDKEIERVLEQNARFVDSDKPAKNGDKVIIDYKGSVDGEYFDGGSAERQNLDIGAGRFIPGFEEQLEGMNVGDERNINVTFPEDYHSNDLAGKDAVFEVTLHEIKEKQLSEPDDEFASEVSEFETMDEYRQSIKDKQIADAEKREKQEQEDKVIEAILDASTVDIPDCMVDDEIDGQIRRMEYSLRYQGLDLEKYFEFTGTTLEQMREDQKEMCAQRVKTRLVLEAIKDAENIDATDDDIEAEIAILAGDSDVSVEEYKKSITDSQSEYIKERAVYSKLVNSLVEGASIN